MLSHYISFFFLRKPQHWWFVADIYTSTRLTLFEMLRSVISMVLAISTLLNTIEAALSHFISFFFLRKPQHWWFVADIYTSTRLTLLRGLRSVISMVWNSLLLFWSLLIDHDLLFTVCLDTLSYIIILFVFIISSRPYYSIFRLRNYIACYSIRFVSCGNIHTQLDTIMYWCKIPLLRLWSW